MSSLHLTPLGAMDCGEAPGSDNISPMANYSHIIIDKLIGFRASF